MNLLELVLLAIGLSMDAFAVAICMGLAMPKVRLKNTFIVGGYFGVFQAGMPLIGYFLASWFSESIQALDHWIAFALLAFIGGKMVWECRKGDEGDDCPAVDGPDLTAAKMLPLAVATSIDALAVGVSFAFLQVQVLPAVSLIGLATFCISFAGVYVGFGFGTKLKSKAELVGGLILIFIGTKILLEHTILLG